MDEQDFDSLRRWQPFERQQVYPRLHRTVALATQLWGRTVDDLKRRLEAPHPEIPSGFDLEDFRQLEQYAKLLVAAVANRNPKDLAYRIAFEGATFVVGTQTYTVAEARSEIVRRAIEYLETR